MIWITEKVGGLSVGNREIKASKGDFRPVGK